MIVTVTPHSGLDYVVFLERFEWGKVLRAQETYMSLGGKGACSGLTLGALGADVLNLGYVAGETGMIFTRIVRERSGAADFIQVCGETRINTVMIDRGERRQSTLTNRTMWIKPEHIEAIIAKTREAASRAGWVLMAGSLPNGAPLDLYPRLIEACRDAGARTLLDASGDYLRAGAEAGPTILKMNEAEIAALTGKRAGSVDAALEMACDLAQSGGSELVIVTLGKSGAVAAGTDGALYRLPPLTVDVVSTAGAGDAFSAGVVAGLDEGRSIPDALRLALAASAATVAHAGTGECDPALVAALYERARCLNPEG